MHPVIFKIPWLEWPIYGYGLMMVIGFLLAAQLAKWLASRCKLDGEAFVNAALLGLASGIIGARLSHVLENLGEFTNPNLTLWANLWNIVNIRSGGLTYYGGFLLAFPTLVIYAVLKRIPIRLGMDIVAPCLMIGLGLGRVGCFLNGCCEGAPCSNDTWYTVRFPYFSNPYIHEFKQGKVKPKWPLVENKDLVPPGPMIKGYYESEHSLPLHAAQLYSTFTALLLAGLCVAFFTIRKTPGMVFAMLMFLEGISRYILELVRDEPPVWAQMSLSMVLGIVLAVVGLILAIVFRKMGPMKPTRQTSSSAAYGTSAATRNPTSK